MSKHTCTRLLPLLSVSQTSKARIAEWTQPWISWRNQPCVPPVAAAPVCTRAADLSWSLHRRCLPTTRCSASLTPRRSSPTTSSRCPLPRSTTASVSPTLGMKRRKFVLSNVRCAILSACISSFIPSMNDAIFVNTAYLWLPFDLDLERAIRDTCVIRHCRSVVFQEGEHGAARECHLSSRLRDPERGGQRCIHTRSVTKAHW